MLFLLVCLVSLGVSVNSYVTDLKEYRQLKTSGVVAWGTLVDWEAQETIDPEYTRYHYVSYKFTDGKSWYTGRAWVHESASRYQEIVYVPSNPEISRLKSRVRPPIPVMPVLCLCLVPLITNALGCFVVRALNVRRVGLVPVAQLDRLVNLLKDREP